MKKNLIYIFILLSVMACLDDKSNYDYKDLNDFENWDRNGVSNVIVITRYIPVKKFCLNRRSDFRLIR